MLPHRLTDSRLLIFPIHAGSPPVRFMSLPESHRVFRLRRLLKFGIDPLSSLSCSSSVSSLVSRFSSGGIDPVSWLFRIFRAVSMETSPSSAGSVPARR